MSQKLKAAITSVGGYVPETKLTNFDLEKLKIILRKQLSSYKCPKYWLAVDQIPRTTLGKINYQHLKQYAKSQLRS